MHPLVQLEYASFDTGINVFFVDLLAFCQHCTVEMILTPSEACDDLPLRRMIGCGSGFAGNEEFSRAWLSVCPFDCPSTASSRESKTGLAPFFGKAAQLIESKMMCLILTG